VHDVPVQAASAGRSDRRRQGRPHLVRSQIKKFENCLFCYEFSWNQSTWTRQINEFYIAKKSHNYNQEGKTLTRSLLLFA
jgi:hypothetical protein